MSKPNYAFATTEQIAYPTDREGVYRLEPASREIQLSLDKQTIPDNLAAPEMERAVMAWVISRGGRTLNLNRVSRPITPDLLDSPAASTPRRIVSIAPSNSEIMGVLGAAELLAGIEASTDFPPEILHLPRLGPDLAVDTELLAELEPDLVLASLSVPGMERNITALDRLGIPFLAMAPLSFEEICDDVMRIGRAIGFERQAEGVVEEMRQKAAKLKAESERAEPVSVYLEWWPKPMFTPTGRCWSNDLISLAGGVNVFREKPGQSAEVTPEEVARANPAVIFISWCGVPFEKLNPLRVFNRKGLESVRAVREGRVYPVNESYLGRPGPRVLDGIETMARLLRQGPH